MLEKIYNKYGLLLLLIIGVVIRLSIYYVSPPTNSYDDHLEVIHEYSSTKNRPLPFSCWECYQPPLYYTLSAATYNAGNYFEFSKELSWKLIQFINPLLSILSLIVFLKILKLFDVRQTIKVLYLSCLIVLPRDIFTSAMIGNDYLLVFLSICSLFFYFKYIKSKREIRYFICLSLTVLMGGLTKQHGLLLLLLPFSILLDNIISSRKNIWGMVTILLIVSTVLLLEELWKYHHTGFLLVSNQHFFDYAVNQFPGSIDQVEFFTFRFLNLFKEPFLSESTAASFSTEIFARTFFDYEHRYFSPKIQQVHFLGRFGYGLGIIWMIFFSIVTWIRLKRKSITENNFLIKYTPVLLGILFLLVPLVQTLRYPYFSSMKAMFILPGLFILFVCHAIYIKDIRIKAVSLSILPVLNIIYGFVLMISFYLFIELSLNDLSGPLWSIP